MSKTQIKHNTEIQGGFLQLLLPALATAGKFIASSVLPKLATGALAGIGQAAGTTAVNKIVGNGVIYWKKNGIGCKIKKSGQGLFLSPWQKGSSLGDGLFLKSGTGYVNGSGLILGPDSPFQNIPILGMLL